MTRRQFLQRGVDATIAADPSEREELGEGRGRQARVEAGKRPQRGDLRAEQERVADPSIDQRLLAEAIAREHEATLPAPPPSEREHALDRVERGLEPPRHEGGQQHFRVGVTSPRRRVPLRLEPRTHVFRVVDLAVEHEHIAAVGGDQGLVAGRARVQHGQPTEAQGEAGSLVDPRALGIGPAGAKSGRHGRQASEHLTPLQGSRSDEVSRQAAHSVTLMDPAVQ